jgi:hypothetical protein
MQSPRVCWGPVRQEARSAKIQRPRFRLGCLQEGHKWPLVGFLRIGTLWRHPTNFGARKRPHGACLSLTSTRCVGQRFNLTGSWAPMDAWLAGPVWLLEKSWRNAEADVLCLIQVVDSIGAPQGTRTPVFAVRGRSDVWASTRLCERMQGLGHPCAKSATYV